MCPYIHDDRCNRGCLGFHCRHHAETLAGKDARVSAWPHDATDRVHQLMGQLAAKELECQRLREALDFVAQHFSTEWPERCQTNVLAARRALGL